MLIIKNNTVVAVLKDTTPVYNRDKVICRLYLTNQGILGEYIQKFLSIERNDHEIWSIILQLKTRIIKYPSEMKIFLGEKRFRYFKFITFTKTT